jgi:crotonobetainyl-CoA:carnitine CoA-transferase CaiB-like acyl-CoA transferase
MTATTTGALTGLRVLHRAGSIAAAYAAKLLVDAGADVVLLEPPGGSALRRRVASGAHLAAGADGAYFAYLHRGQRAIELAEGQLPTLLAAADVFIGDDQLPTATGTDHLISVVISDFGTEGPRAGQPASELTLQAMCGSLGARGDVGSAPLAAGGQTTECAAGVIGAVSALIALRARAATGRGEQIDVSRLEVGVLIYNGFRTVAAQLTGTPPSGPARVIELPSVLPASDGWVGFCTNTAAQFAGFATLVGHPEWATDPEIRRGNVRTQLAQELLPPIEAFTRAHTVAELVDRAAALRVPVAPVAEGSNVVGLDHFLARGVFQRAAGESVREPRIPYQFSRAAQPAPGGVPPRAANTEREVLAGWAGDRRWLGNGSTDEQGPLADLRVLDLTAFWAGPCVGQLLAAFGADVIKVESVQRPDGTRMTTAYAVGGDQLWERSPVYQGANTGKRDVTLDLADPRGLALVRRLLEQCSIVIENSSPRVFEKFGLLESVTADQIVTRMPAWGLSGPWRDRPGFAQNVEQGSGLAWLTGRPDGPPIVPRGPCDPLGGLHAAFAILVALLARDADGEGEAIEASLVEPALCSAAEQLVEFEAYGRLLSRIGNRSRLDAPQGVYRCAGPDSWVAITVVGDQQWLALCAVLHLADWAARDDLRGVAGRFAAHDEIDTVLADRCAGRPVAQLVEQLLAAGIAAAEVVEPHLVGADPQLRARAFLETVDHPVVGALELPGFPARFASRSGPFHHSAAPTLGQHNHEVLTGLLGLSAAEIETLEAAGVIGTVPL